MNSVRGGDRSAPRRIFIRDQSVAPRHYLVAAAALALMLFAFATMAPASHAATGRIECASTPSRILGHSVPFCILLPPSFDAEKTRRYPILYYLHGLGDNEQMFVRSGGWNLVEDLWEGHRIGDYLIATPAADASFYINSRDGRVRYQDFLLQEFIPQIERRYRASSTRDSRGVAGISMGGYGALRLAFLHPELFVSASAQSAALIERLPTVDVPDPTGNLRLRILGDVFGSPPDRAFWDRNSPLTIARTANLARLKIYFDCGTEDDYGFNAGASTLDSILMSRHIAHEFHLYPGQHSWQYFAEHLPDSLEFHSHAFGLNASAK